MGRAFVQVQPVDQDLQSQFIDLWIGHRVEAGTTREAAERLAADGTLRDALGRSDIHALMAFVDGSPAGYVVLADSTRSLLVTTPCVSVDMLYVDADHRHQGVGKALLGAACRYADRMGSEHIVSSVPAQDRDANRYFARLGFVPETMHRVISSANLQRKLAGEPKAQRYSLEQVLQRRRDLRARDRGTAAANSQAPPVEA